MFFICIANCLTSFVTGFAIFGTLGYLANLLGQEVADVVAAGPTLAFVTYPGLVRYISSYFNIQTSILRSALR